ncbi:segmentation protein cap'n'collar isoform X1 [Culex pipiens pallens]|nr:segmentation protein cap'n'collar isoform X1 [Culex pipiens pallens]
MISYKKNYVEHLLHLALTLSLLRVDPENFLDLQWETRLAGTGVGGWQLELRAAPLTDQTYVNRKALPSIIEDLARFDTRYNLPPSISPPLQTYLLNIQNSNSTNQTASTRASSPLPTQETPNSTTSVVVDSLLLPNFESFEAEDIFLNPDPFADSTSILEQNMADLEDFGEAPINTYALDAIPLKNEPPPLFDDLIRLPTFDPHEHLFNQENLGDEPGSSHHQQECCQSCDARQVVKQERMEEGEEGEVRVKQEPGTCEEQEQLNAASSSMVVVKKEEIDPEEEEERKVPVTAELTLEEMDLIEVLWKQDVDLGFTLTPPTAVVAGGTGSAVAGAKGGADSSDDLEKLKVLLEIKNDDDKKKDDKKEPEEDPWAGLSYTIDTETGEYVLNATDDSEGTLPPPLADLFLEEELNLPELINGNANDADGTNAATEETDEPAKKKTTAEEEEEESEVKRIERELETSADELCQGAAAAGSSVDLKSATDSVAQSAEEKPEKAAAANGDKDPLPDDPEAVVADDLEDLLCDMMIQTSSSHFQHPRQPMQNYGHGMHHGSLRQGSYHHHHHYHQHHQSRVPLSRAVSMEQRFQDVANLLGFPPGMGFSMGVGEMAGPAHPHAHYPPHHYSYQATGSIPQHAGQYHSHAAVLQNASLAELGGQPGQPPYYAGAPNLGSAVSSSMHLTNSTSETDAGATGYKMEHEMMYYSNTSSEMNHTDTSFLNTILDDELQLIDIANEGMYTMRMLDPNATSSNSSVLGGGAVGGSNSGHLGGLMPSTAAAAAALTGAMQHGGGAVGGITSAATTTSGATGTGGDRLDASSDSAVSSMGSERVPSLSDGEWGDGGSDSAQEYHNKYGGPYDYSYSGNSSRMGDGSRQAPVAQKKHQMFGKRFLMEQNATIPALAPASNSSSTSAVDPQLAASIPIKYEYDYMTPASLSHLEGAVGPVPKQEDQTNSAHNPLSSVDMKYPYSLDFARQNPAPAVVPRNLHHDVIQHNHTYTLPHNSGANPKPQTRDKKIRRSEEEHLTRDEKRARALNIPITVQDIINLPMDEFNERLSKYDLSETQLSLIRDIRRRGKNKVAAQNCRKRKLDQIVSLADEVKEMKNRKERLLREREAVLSEQKKIRKKYMDLYRHIFEHLRDDDGNPISMEHYTLQQRADGPVMLLPRSVDRQQELAGSSSGSSSSSSSSHHHQQQMMMHHHGGHHSHHHPHHHLQQHQQQQQHAHPHSNATTTGPSGSGSGSSSAGSSSNSTIHSQHRPKE